MLSKRNLANIGYSNLKSLENEIIHLVKLFYFQEWLPNELSAILIEDFTSAKDLADHLHNLHKNDHEYLAYLRQKPSINDNHLSRISNEYLIQAMNLRSWGVSDKDQMVKGI